MHAPRHLDAVRGRASELAVLEEEILACRACPRLVAWREEVAKVKRRAYREWEYWGRAVPGFGDPRPGGLYVLGLAPGAHGQVEGGPSVLGCYHVSQQNTQTGRLTAAMFDAVLERALALRSSP